jgi:hypothetical protein
MIQFNLLPDVKLEFVRAQRVKHAVVSGAVIASGAAFLIFLLLFIAVHVVQTKMIHDQTADIKKYSEEIKNTPDMEKILTIQQQLGVLPKMHASKPAAVRTFALLQQLTPPSVSLTQFTVDYTGNTMEFIGVAPSLDLVNTMVDTVKYTTYKNTTTSDKKVFSGVVMSSFTRNPKNSTFAITAKYDPIIFNNTDTVSFKVPNGISTPSFLGQPTTVQFTKPNNETTN